MSIEAINEYYNQAKFDYEWVWRIHKNFSIHYGFYDRTHRTHNKALINFNRILADMAAIGSQDHVLDAGCGVGGSSVWIAKNRGAKVTGININENQLSEARELAKRNDVLDSVRFIQKNFMDTGFPDNSFDVVWGLESICYAEDKKAFLNEARRILKDHGRIIIADGFQKKKDLSEVEQKTLDKWLKGWAVPNLAEIQSFKGNLEELGFRNIIFRDVTGNIVPSSKRMYWATIAIYPLAKMMQFLELRTEIQMKNMMGAYYQLIALKQDLWAYVIFYAVK